MVQGPWVSHRLPTGVEVGSEVQSQTGPRGSEETLDLVPGDVPAPSLPGPPTYPADHRTESGGRRSARMTSTGSPTRGKEGGVSARGRLESYPDSSVQVVGRPVKGPLDSRSSEHPVAPRGFGQFGGRGISECIRDDRP